MTGLLQPARFLLVALLAATAGILVTAVPAAAAEDPPPVSEDFAYPGAAQILADHGLKVFKGDGQIRFVTSRPFGEGQCPSGQLQVERNLDVEPYGVYYCFQQLAAQGFLTLEVPGTFGIRGGTRTVEATAVLPEGERTFTVPPAQPVAISPGTGEEPPRAVLVELRMAPASLPAGPDSPHPFVARILAGERGCSGVLVAPQWLATAKSCFGDDVRPGTPPEPATATVGRSDLTAGGGHTAAVTELVPRPERDLVLAKLAAPAAGIAPLTLGETAPGAGDGLQGAGYGRREADWPGHQLQSRAFTVAVAAATTVDLRGGACRGDAGGPVFRTSGDRTELVGVQSRSWQAGCPGVTETRDATLAARTDDLAGWIRLNTADPCRTPEQGFDALTGSWAAAGPGGVTDAGCELAPADGATLLQFTGRRLPAAYTLRLDWKATGADSDAGVVLGASRGSADRGVEVQINPDGTGTAATGAVLGRAPSGEAEHPVGSWNTYEIAVSQRRVTVRLNGTPVNDVTVTDPARLLASGLLSLQTDPAGAPVRFRNVRVRTDEPGAAARSLPVLYDYSNGLTRLWLFRNVGQSPMTTQITWDSGAGNWDTWRSTPVSGDFDGDGKTDAAAFYNYGGAHTRMFLFPDVNGSGPVAPRQVWDSGAGNWDAGRSTFVAGDFDGDGRSEIGGFYNYGNGHTRLWVFSGIGGTISTRIAWDSGPGNWDAGRSTFRTGDFDGDGRSEIGAFYNYDGGLTRLFVFAGVNGAATTRVAWDSGAGNWDAGRSTFVAGDYDADGRTDLGGFYNYGGGHTRLFTFTGIAGNASVRQVWDSGAGNWDAGRHRVVARDFDGDGDTEIGAFYDYGGSLTRLFLFSDVVSSGPVNVRAVWESGAGNWDMGRTTLIP
jgi:hypothetical protein